MIKLKEIANEYLRSFPENPEEEAPQKEDGPVTLALKIKKGKLSEQDIVMPSAKEVSKTLLSSVLPKSGLLTDALAREKTPVLEKNAYQDFTLLAGNVASPGASVLNRLKRTHTEAGACVMATEIANPKTDHQLLDQQQAGLRALQNHKKAKNKLDNHMSAIATGEKVRTLLWRKDSEVNASSYQKELKRCYFSWFGLDRFNTSPIVLQCRKMGRDLLNNYLFVLFFSYLSVVVVFGCWDNRGWTIMSSLFNKPLPSWWFEGVSFSRFFFVVCHLFLQVILLGTIPFSFLLWPLFAEKGSYISQNFTLENVSHIFHLDSSLFLTFSLLPLYYFLFWWRFYSYFRKTRATINFLGFHLAAFQDLLLRADKIQQIVAQNLGLKAAYGKRLAKTRALLRTKDGEVGQLVHYLQTTTFRNRWYYFSHTGKLLATYKLLEKHKDALADLIYEMGMLDVQLGVVKLMEAHQMGAVRNPITFGTFVKASDNRPQLHASGIWHPLLATEDAVPNDIIMDFEQAFLIITGPNGGGKSIYILCPGLNVILHQALGIAFAKTFVQTVFYRIISYINVTQNISKGFSLGEAGMEVLRAHKQILSQTPQPILAIVDEILNGVDPKVAEKYSYKILKDRSPAHPNCLTLVTTHLMVLTELAKEDKRFHNKKVVVEMPGKNGRAFDYTYQIHDGITDQNVVEMMLQEKGVF